MEEVIKVFLKGQGLNDKDISVYLDIYIHGQSLASTISARTMIDRTTVYSVLKRLLNSGVVVQARVNAANVYLAVSPEVFIDKVDRDFEALNLRRKSAMLFVKEMAKIKKEAFLKPKVRVFEGDEGIVRLYNETLEKGSEQKSFLTIKRIPPSLQDFLKRRFIQEKIKKGVFSKVILANTSLAENYAALDRRSNRESRIVKSHPFDLHSEIVLFGKSEVAIIDFHKQVFGIVIESGTLFKTIETLFDYVWETEAKLS